VCKKFRVGLAFVYRVQKQISGVPGCGDEYEVPNLQSEIEVHNMCLFFNLFQATMLLSLFWLGIRVELQMAIDNLTIAAIICIICREEIEQK